jgi:hypothetical protein
VLLVSDALFCIKNDDLTINAVSKPCGIGRSIFLSCLPVSARNALFLYKIGSDRCPKRYFPFPYSLMDRPTFSPAMIFF